MFLRRLSKHITLYSMSDSSAFVTLSELQDGISRQLDGMECWVKVEIDSHSQSNGHHYFGFIEKSPSGELLAKARGVLWRGNSSMLTIFRKITGKDIEAGMEIVLYVSVNYDARFGLSLIIEDIDENFTIGNREKEKQATIKKLEDEELMERQKELELGFLPGRIAVVSSRDAAGYGDFVKHLSDNQYGYTFNTTLFPALMQGESCAQSISDAVHEASKDGLYDLILILRGGGAQSDLFPYDEYELARAIALCPVPVLTAIGHERDFHIADMVAYDYFKTPTAMADFLIEWVLNVESQWQDTVRNIKYILSSKIQMLDSALERTLVGIKASDPRILLKQGYLLAVGEDGKIVKSASSKAPGDNFSLRFGDGKWDCVIKGVDYEC